MPRKVDPGTIRSGSGFSTSEDCCADDRSELFKHMTSNPAHPASAISIEDATDRYSSGNVEGALDELSSLVPPKPPTLGNYSRVIGLSGIPDWGVLKLNDSKLDERPGAAVSPVDLAEAFGYWWFAGDPADTDPPFSPLGADPVTDDVFNVVHGIYTGGGPAASYAGAYTPDVGGPNPITQTMRIVESSGIFGSKPVIVSGAVYPADRGVLALLFWPARGSITDFLAQPLTEKCKAAIVLGGGLGTSCDGGMWGGIFYPGGSGSGDFEPFDYPGQATGQYSLAELHTGDSDIDGSPLPSPFDPGSANPAAGQVRLGTDPNAGVPIVPGGVPILGATTAATGGGNDNNFFRYRLPYLEDYSVLSGLQYTPNADKPRYFMKPVVSLDPGTDLTQAGDYEDLPKDFWSMQIARFRHRFTMDSSIIGASDPREDGSYILLHFKTEAAFESLVRDGIAPSNTDLYSANLTDWIYAEDPSNIAEDNLSSGFPISPGYHLIRSSIFEDPGVIGPVITRLFDYSPSPGGFMCVSGVWYFVAKASSIADSFTLTDIDFSVNNFWTYSYRTTSPGKTGDAYIGTMNPGIMVLPQFSYSEIAGVPTHDPGGIVSDPAFVKRQRCDLSFWELYAPNAASNGPLPADPLTFFFTSPQSWEILGDLDYPSFSQDARPVASLFKPLGHEDASTLYFRRSLNPVDGNDVLFHSMRNVSPVFGNVTTGGFFVFGTALPSLQTAEKDTTERFLDEVYRYSVEWDPGGILNNYLTGPGLPGAPVVLDVPVRAGTAASPWDASSYLQNGHHLTDLSLVPGNELQVAGLPRRSPTFSVTEAIINPFPSAGMVYYPRETYTSGYRPNFAIDGQTQFDYSSLIGDREYVRAFDAAFSRSASPLTPEGQPFFTLRVRGLELSDFAYSPPGPGTQAIAIMIKVPGLTTWMDLGRNDGSGPGKQDPISDGAGCKVLGPETFDSHNIEDRVVYCEVKVNVGPSANLFRNSENEVPILVKVRIKDTPQGRDLDFTQGPFNDDNINQRALVGLEIVYPVS